MYVDDTFVIQKVEHSDQFLQHINSIDCHIQFTTENPEDNGSIPLLDTVASLGPNNTLTTSVYRKCTHTDKYFQMNSNHSFSTKYNVFKTLTHRAKVACTNQLQYKEEEDHIRQALLGCNYPNWALNRLQTKQTINSVLYRPKISLADTQPTTPATPTTITST